MKITDEGIAEYCEAAAVLNDRECFDGSILRSYFDRQKFTDLLRYINSSEPVDEMYLTAAMCYCADCAGMFDEFADAPDEAFDAVWAEIEKRLRAMQRRGIRRYEPKE